MLLRVALPIPIFAHFDYLVDELALANLSKDQEQDFSLLIGCRVLVPFGNKQLIGIIIDTPSQSDYELAKLKPIIQIVDETPVFTEQLLELAYWLSSYYLYPLGDTISVMMPRHLRDGKAPTNIKTHWQITDTGLTHSFSKQAKKQQAQFSLIAKLCESNTVKQINENLDSGSTEEHLIANGVTRVMLKKLAEKNLIKSYFAEPQKTTASIAEQPLTLNSHQQTAFEKILASIKEQRYKGYLLFGITGSGKTEVYLQIIHEVLKKGQQALVLVPEIGLTPQTVNRFKARFHATIVTLHSGMNETERLESWSQLSSGHAHIIIGTRSSVLAPFADLGLIIVDEEHDGSYKQQTTLRYHARDVALYRGVQENCPVILGSATPSLDSLHRVANGKLSQLDLPERAGNATTATLKVVDIRGKFTQSSLCDTSLDAISHTLKKNEQVLVFLNRRGYSPSLICEACGWVADCPRCDARLTLHYQPYHYLKCHHCDYQSYKPKKCNDCHSTNLKPTGTGTARLEELLSEKFPDYPLFRIDADTTRRKNSWAKLYQQINTDKPAILLGTQMLAKGHHFPNVTLVVMPNIDNGFASSDFRAPEKVAQLMLQVAGRAGRSDKKGLVLIQSLQPENPLLLQLVRHGYADFAQQTLQERQSLMLPPYRFSALVRVEGKSAEGNHAFLQSAKQLLDKLNDELNNSKENKQHLVAWGPLPSPMHKKANRYHTQLFMLSNNRKLFHELLQNWWLQVLALPERNYAKATLDIDAVEF